ncbi:hypothetical protein Hanom_Chr02g00138101 [Helianthus anomalus]
MMEQDQNSQIGSALCLSTKPTLLCVIGSIVGAGGTGLNRNSLSLLSVLAVAILNPTMMLACYWYGNSGCNRRATEQIVSSVGHVVVGRDIGGCLC